MLSVGITVAATYALLLAAVYVFQPRMLYLPNIAGSGLSGTPSRIGLPFENAHFETRDGVRLHGWFVPARASEAKVLMHCHGNGGNISHRLELLRLLHDMGLSVFLFDYRGYGLSEGKPTEAGTYLDAQAGWDYLVEERGYAPDDIVLSGHSLGAAIAAHLAQTVRPAAVILEAPFSSAPDIAAHHYPFLPARRLTRFDYDTAQYVRRISAPLLVVHSAQDRIVPIEQGRRVFESAEEPKAFLEIAGDHNAGFVLSGDVYMRGIRDFIARHGAPAHAN